MGLVIWLNGLAGSGKSTIGKHLYEILKKNFSNLVYLDGDEFREVLGHFGHDRKSRIDIAIKRSKLCHFLSSQGINVIATTISLFDEIYRLNRINFKNYLEIYIQCPMNELIERDQKNLYSQALKGKIKNVVGIDIPYDKPQAHLVIDNKCLDKLEAKTLQILSFMKEHEMSLSK